MNSPTSRNCKDPNLDLRCGAVARAPDCRTTGYSQLPRTGSIPREIVPQLRPRRIPERGDRLQRSLRRDQPPKTILCQMHPAVMQNRREGEGACVVGRKEHQRLLRHQVHRGGEHIVDVRRAVIGVLRKEDEGTDRDPGAEVGHRFSDAGGKRCLLVENRFKRCGQNDRGAVSRVHVYTRDA
jgi:hypothetical protein